MQSLFKVLVAMLLAIPSAYSADVLWNNRLEGTGIYSGQMLITDGDFSELGSSAFTDVRSFGYLRLGIGEVPQMTYTSAMTTFLVTVRITPYSNTGVMQTPFTETLKAEYTIGQGAGVTIDADDYRMTGVHKFLVEVQTVNINNTNVSASAIPNYIYLEAGYSGERYYQFNTALAPAAVHNYITYNALTGVPATAFNQQGTATSATTDEIELSWEYIPGAEYYDLEWTWVDNYSATSLAGTRPMSDIALSEQDFNRNSTRIRTSKQSYRIPQTFAKGYLVYRVRGVGRWATAPTKDLYGRWSGPSTTKAFVSDWTAAGLVNVITIGYEHESGKNWQYQATYAEDGKKKEMTQYFDGSLRGRQTVTRINSDNHSVVGETIYDNEGRPAIQVLPVPQKNPGMQYYPDVNNNLSNQTYSHRDFDWETTGQNCVPAAAGAMSPTNPAGEPVKGASNYYSPAAHATDTDWQQYVPDAGNYPFSQVEYTPDNTGRIRNQSGIGATHKIGSGHETVYYYLQPSQEELDRLFGYKVGYKQRYKKNMVVDANNQVSISYLDAQGRTIATALAGDNVTAFQDIDSENGPNHLQTSTDLLNKLTPQATDTEADDNVAFSTGRFGAAQDGLKMGTQIGVIQDGIYNFNYTVQAGVFQSSCEGGTSVSYPFVYDLRLSLRDNCGAEVFTHTYQSVGTTAIGTSTGAFLAIDEVNHLLKQGNYTLYKELIVNEASLEAYKADYLSASNTCLLPESAFLENVQESCNLDCAECAEALGTLAQYLVDAQTDEGHVLTPTETEAYTNLYNQELENCIASCVPLTSCDAYRGQMLTDLQPQGQYGGMGAGDPLSVFNTGNALTGHWKSSTVTYLDANGNPATVPVNYDGTTYTPSITGTDPAASNGNQPGIYHVDPKFLTSVSDFINLFDPAWAEALLPFHPEYVLYEYATDICNLTAEIAATSTTTTDDFLVSSEAFDDMLRTHAYTYAEAQNLQFTLNGLDFYDVNLLQTGELDDIDPFFAITYPDHQAGSSTGTALKNSLMQAALANYDNSGFSMIRQAARTVLYGNDYDNSMMAADPNWAGNATLADFAADYPNDIDAIWLTYKSYYLSYKSKINQLFMDVYGYTQHRNIDVSMPGFGTVTVPVGIYNGAIGNGGVGTGVAYAFAGDATNFPGVIALIQNTYNTVTSGSNSNGSYVITAGPSALAGTDYNSKQARIVRVDALYNASLPDEATIAALTQDADYAMWQESGLCPLMIDMERFLDAAGRENHLISGGNMDNTNELTADLFQALTGAAPVGSSSMTYAGTLSGSNLNLTFTSGMSNTTFVLPQLDASLPWNQYNSSWHIYGVSHSYPVPSTNNVQILVLAGTSLAAAQEYVITYQSPIALNGCQTEFATNGNLDPACTKEEEFEGALLALMQKLLQNGTLLNTGVPLSTLSEYTQSVLPDYLGSGTPTWNGPNINNIMGLNAGSAAFLLELNTALPSGLQAITGVDIIGNSIYVSYMTASAIGSVSGLHNYTQGIGKYVRPDFSCPCGDAELTAEEAIAGYFNHLLTGPVLTCGAQPQALEDLAPYLTMADPVMESSYTLSLSGITSTVAANSSTVCTDRPPTCTLSLSGNATAYAIVSISDVVLGTGGAFTCTGMLSNNTTTALNGSMGCFRTPPCDDCLPQIEPPLSCNGAYTSYENTMHAHFAGSLSTEELTIFEEEYHVTEETFCDNSYVYIASAYAAYLNQFNITSLTDDRFVTIAQFGATPIGYSNTKLSAAVTAYYAYQNPGPGNEIPDFITWNDYVSTIYLPAHPEVCPAGSPGISFPTPVIVTPCDQWENAVAVVNQQTQYDIYLAQIAASFEQDYLERALSTVVETFNESHQDKEYHYTLYYYDRAGNLVQTVPPKGVDRLEVGETGAATYDEIDAFRAASPDEFYGQIDGVKYAPDHTMETVYRYNSLNQLVYQRTPDGGESRFAYDRLGRLVLSQNAKQAVLSPERFSYVCYDALGRVVEAGELIANNAYNYSINELGGLNYGATPYTGLTGVNDPAFPANIAASRVEVTRSIYDELGGMTTAMSSGTATIASLFGSDYAALSTRNRIVGVIYQETYNSSNSTFDNGTFYDYDVHGHVKHLIQVNRDPDLVALNQHIKHLQYDYDLVSGNVNKVIYQKGYADQFIHRYAYDADNRITIAETSKDDVYFEKDAKYFYYDHGLLARTEIGDKKVQAQDYAYTIQSWVKAVNGEQVYDANMMGKDGQAAINAYAGRDVYGYSLSYFNGDYNAYNTAMLGYSRYAGQGGANGTTAATQLGANLYNGNIRAMYTALSNTNENIGVNPLATHETRYAYDQLNRIKGMDGFTVMNTTAPAYTASGYSSTYSFDPNGNLLTMTNTAATSATNAAPLTMDNFRYKYLKENGATYDPLDPNPAIANPSDATNRLAWVDDLAGASLFGNADVDDSQNADNYAYDKIGQLTKDTDEGITNITWTVTNKVKQVTKSDGSTIVFEYDAMGYRIAKKVTVGSATTKTYYVVDAQGNPVSTYERKIEDSGNNLYLSERNLYGSSRFGVEDLGITLPLGMQTLITPAANTHYRNTNGDKLYELSNHLDNVLNVLRDRKLASNGGGGTVVAYSVPDVVSFSDYYPYGMVLPNRNSNTSEYRYGFNGMEVNSEECGCPNKYSTLYREYDARIARWKSPDPMERSFPTENPYNNNFNNPILMNDPNGDCPPCLIWGIVEGVAWLSAAYFASDAVEEGLDYAVTGDKNYDFGVGNSENARQLFRDGPTLSFPQTKTKPQPTSSTKPDTKTKPKPDPTPPPLPVAPKEKEDEPEYIYRGGSNTDKTYTMRPEDLVSKKYPVPGMSAATTPEQAAGDKGGKVQKLSVEILRKQGMTVIFDGNGHVTVTTLNENNRKKWAESRAGLQDGLLGQIKAHYITRKVAMSRVGEQKVVK